jgi:hypothetical protein
MLHIFVAKLLRLYITDEVDLGSKHASLPCTPTDQAWEAFLKMYVLPKVASTKVTVHQQGVYVVFWSRSCTTDCAHAI